MKKIKIVLVLVLTILNAIVLTGCWNYREVNEIAIVAGLAIDKGTQKNYQMTVELIKITGGKDSKMSSKIITAEGDTLFDAARNLISLSGKRLYWSHAEVLILSQEIAKKGITSVLDWYSRDSETREDTNILISKEPTAKEIFESQVSTEDIKSFVLYKALNNQASLSKAPTIDILNFNIATKLKPSATVVPTVSLINQNGNRVPQVLGSAIIKNDKLMGFLDADETKDLIFIRNKIKGGVLVQNYDEGSTKALITFEIFNNETKIKPAINGQEVQMDLKLKTTVAIDEIEGQIDFSDDIILSNLEQATGATIKQRMESLIKKLQQQYDADIFGFSACLQEEKAKDWKKIENNWDKIFKNVKTTIQVSVQIKNSAIRSNDLKDGEQ